MPGKKIELDKIYGRPDERTIQDDSIGTNKFIKEGGVVRIGNILCRIESVDDSTGKVTIDTDVPTNFTKAEFIYALVIDHINGGEYIDQKTGELENDDGDGFEEKLSLTGSTYDWSVVINSKEISDGPVKMYYLAYDKAGNCSTIKAQETMVQNNRPAIAKVWLGTDLNGDNKITNSEEVLYREDETRDTAKGSVIVDAKDFTAKGLTSIRPEIVGGNDNLYYYEKNTVDKNDYEINRKLLRNGEDDENAENDEAIYLELEEDEDKITTLEGKYDTGTKKNSNETETFTFKIWDSTPGLTPGHNSLSATITVSMKIDVVDDVAPTVVINPLCWNSKSDNSLYKKSTKNGHIDLSADLPETFKEKVGETVVTGDKDRDDKVSGKITFKGTAYDDVCLEGLNISFEEFNFGEGIGKDFKVITSDADEGTLNNDASSKAIGVDGWEFSFEEEYLDQRGHYVTWTLSIDTSKINGVAATDKNLKVTATDKGRNSSSTEKVESEDETKKNVPSYKVDVVPYITGVKTWLVGELKTSLQDAYSRTALGHYIIAEQEGDIEVTGFNLDDDAKKIDSKTATTGAYSVKVNGIESLNNLNNNNAKGSYTDSITEESSYEIKNTYAYNRLANGRTNNLLTDDIIFVVWEFDSDAAIPESGKLSEPVMKINPVTGKVGFAFVSGPAHFAMGDGTDNSYETYQRNYATFTNVAMAYDENGNSYGVTTGLDTYPQKAEDTYAGRFTFMTSKWGVGNLNDALDNYLTNNKIRFEAIGVQGNKKCYVKGLYPDTYTMTEFRFASPSMAVTTHGEDATVYLAYYDDIQDQIRFRYGTVGATRASFDNFVDNKGVSYDYEDNNGGGGWNSSNNFRYVFESDTANFSLIAGADWQKNDTTGEGTGYTKKVENNYFYDTGYEADAYVAIDAIKGTTAENDVVVAVWYDGKDCYYAYNTTPRSGKDNGPEGGWVTKKIFSGGGEYCTIKVDSSKGIHIAANVDGSLKYAYLSSYNADFSEDTQAIQIDSCAITGEQITIDVGKKTIGNKTYEIPYISYYMSASKKPCIAYITENAISNGTMNYAAAGTDENDCFTGNWEVSVIPAQSQLSGGNSDKINVGLWKDTSGNIVSSSNDIFTAKDISNEKNESKTDSGNCYGNGTTNPIFGYAVKSTSGTCIETAQLK